LVKRYDGRKSGPDRPKAVEVSPDNSTVFVAGTSYGGSVNTIRGQDYATVAYDTSTNTTLWTSRYDAATSQDDARGLGGAPTARRYS
jgi:hypothetical protein